MRSVLSCRAAMCGGAVSLTMVRLMGLAACASCLRRSTKRTVCVLCPALRWRCAPLTVRPACSVLPASLLDEAARVGGLASTVCARLHRATATLSKPQAAPACVVPCARRHPDCHRCPRTRPRPETSRGAPAAVAASRTLRNGRMCTTDMRLAKLHNDQETNANEQRNKHDTNT